MPYHQEVVHDGLNKRKLITGNDLFVVRKKAEQQLAVWEEEWRRKQQADREAQARREAAEEERRQRKREAEQRRQQREDEAERLRQEKQQRSDDALKRTQEAESAIAAVGAILEEAIRKQHVLNAENLMDRRPFPKPPPARRAVPAGPPPPAFAPEPQRRPVAFEKPAYDLLDSLLTARKRQKDLEASAQYRARVEQAGRDYERQHADWVQHCRNLRSKHEEQLRGYRAHLKQIERHHQEESAAWENERAEYLAAQESANAVTAAWMLEYPEGNPAAVESYCTAVLAKSEYCIDFNTDPKVSFNDQTGMLLVDVALPLVTHLPTLKAVKYAETKDEVIESQLSERELAQLYDDVIYQIALRSIYEVYDADAIEIIEAVVLNGWTTSLDRATGRDVTACVVSVQASKKDFLETNWTSVEPKACFKKLKGIAGTQLSNLTPIAPIMMVDRQDARFVPSYDVIDGLDASENIAAMDWEDFEHLVRELFAREFSQNGGEVKVTQASRDGGVDAVAFDPNPITGGKIVIQAKRYTNTVGVSAVRDLYGTLMNEGAMKGILVTTSDFGPDAHEFAKGKPLTLLSGNNLLHLLEKHGRSFRIDLKEAKEKLGSSE